MKFPHHLWLTVIILLLALQCKPLYLDSGSPQVSANEIPRRRILSNDTPSMEISKEVLFLEEGDNLGRILSEHIHPPQVRDDLLTIVSQHCDLRRMQPGQEFHIIHSLGTLVGMDLINSDTINKFILEDGTWTAREEIRTLKTLIRFSTGYVDSSLYNAALDAQIPLGILMEMIQLFSFDVDFQRDIYKGDFFQIAYEEIYDEQGQKVESGRVIFAYLYSNGATVKHELFQYIDTEGNVDYYDSQGHSVRKELLKTPVNGAYISSGYGMRINPFLGYSRMHKGVDFAAPQGTPIYAAGSGTVTYAGWSDIYGWYVKVRHVNHYETLYAHMVNFSRGLRRGSRVEQGQVIGYVGNTGMSTGPHCHYEVLYYGSHINPSTVRFPPGKILTGVELELFSLRRDSLISSFL